MLKSLYQTKSKADVIDKDLVNISSDHYQSILMAYGLTFNMSRKGNCLNNATADSFFHKLKTE